MKRYVFLFACLCLLPFFSGCRKDLLHWQEVTRINTGTTARLNRAMFLADGTGVISAGAKFDQARILISADGGNKWESRIVPGLDIGLYGISTIPGSNDLVFSGEYGNIVRTPDLGGTFTVQKTSPVVLEFVPALVFTSPGKCLAVTDLTRDSGALFIMNAAQEVQQYKRYMYSLHDIVMFGTQTGYAAGSGAVMKTTDGGSTWENLTIIGDNFRRIWAIDSNRLWICGYNGSIVRTLDGGKTWKKLRNGNDITKARYHLEAIYFRDEQHGYAVGEQGLVCYTDDGGGHWMEFDRFTSDALLFIVPTADGRLLVGGENGSLYKLLQK